MRTVDLGGLLPGSIHAGRGGLDEPCATCGAAIGRSCGQSDERPDMAALWRDARGDREKFRDLMLAYGYARPRLPGEQVDPLPCGWRVTAGRQGGKTADLVDDVYRALARSDDEVVMIVSSDELKAHTLGLLGDLANDPRVRVETIYGNRCPRRGCGASIPRTSAFCRRDWYRLSRPTRQRIWTEYERDAGSNDHLRALADAIAELG